LAATLNHRSNVLFEPSHLFICENLASHLFVRWEQRIARRFFQNVPSHGWRRSRVQVKLRADTLKANLYAQSHQIPLVEISHRLVDVKMTLPVPIKSIQEICYRSTLFARLTAAVLSRTLHLFSSADDRLARTTYGHLALAHFRVLRCAEIGSDGCDFAMHYSHAVRRY
jgi:hypothetical protein